MRGRFGPGERSMKVTSAAIGLAAFLASGVALAGDDSPRTAVLEALESQATVPARHPTLPDPMSDQAGEAPPSVALEKGKKNSAEHAAHRAAQAARNDSAAVAAKKAADAAVKRAEQKSQAAAAEQRAEEEIGRAHV